MTIEALAELLHETAERHDPYEQAAEPHHWWDWYAAYIVARDQGRTADEAVAEATAHPEGARQ
jgi:hypothetical protein